jgi:oligoribonuclease NrnB/cAMP/cGMP phosphodiesterase (DHH superfamily)
MLTKDDRIVIMHHNDPDGYCAAAIANRKVESQGACAAFIPMQYGKPIPYAICKGADVIVMVDFSASPEDMFKLKDMCRQFIWIDHHETALDKMGKAGFETSGTRKVGKSGCELSWEFFFPTLPMPFAVRLIGRYDVWDLDYAGPDIPKGDVLAFYYGCQGVDLYPQSEIWGRWLTRATYPTHTVVAGKTILAYLRRTYAQLCDTSAYSVWLDDRRFIALNSNFRGSLQFDSIYDPKKHAGMLVYGQRSDGQWTVSLYSTRDDIHVGEIAAKYGGGGHKGAAGFVCNTMMLFHGNFLRTQQ